MPNIILLGASGTGKSTLGAWLATHAGYTHIEGRRCVAQAVDARTPLGTTISAAWAQSPQWHPLADELFAGAVLPVLAATPRWVCEGFPRTVAQSALLDHWLTTHSVAVGWFWLTVPAAVCDTRIARRKRDDAVHVQTRRQVDAARLPALRGALGEHIIDLDATMPCAVLGQQVLRHIKERRS